MLVMKVLITVDSKEECVTRSVHGVFGSAVASSSS